MEEFQTSILGLETTLDIDIHHIEVFRDSKLIINQIFVECKVCNLDLNPYHEYASRFVKRFDSVKIKFVPRSENREVYALDNFPTILARLDKDFSTPYQLFKGWCFCHCCPFI